MQPQGRTESGSRRTPLAQRRAILYGFVAAAAINVAQGQGSLQGELKLTAASATERNAGVWLDGQYVGFVGDLRGSDRLVLVPGPHELLIKLIGYEDLNRSLMVEPDQVTDFRVSMAQDPDAFYPEKKDTARLRLEVKPETAAIFVNDTFAGHVDRFDGRKGMRIASGTYRFTIALPGYESFHTELTLRADQTYEIKTELSPGQLSDQAADLISASPDALQQGE